MLVPSALIQLISQLGKRWFYLSGLQGTHPGAVAGSGGRQQPTGRLQIPRKTRSDLLSKPDIVGISMLLAAFALVSSARASCHTSCSALSRFGAGPTTAIGLLLGFALIPLTTPPVSATAHASTAESNTRVPA